MEILAYFNSTHLVNEMSYQRNVGSTTVLQLYFKSTNNIIYRGHRKNRKVGRHIGKLRTIKKIYFIFFQKGKNDEIHPFERFCKIYHKRAPNSGTLKIVTL